MAVVVGTRADCRGWGGRSCGGFSKRAMELSVLRSPSDVYRGICIDNSELAWISLTTSAAYLPRTL